MGYVEISFSQTGFSSDPQNTKNDVNYFLNFP